MIATRSAFMLAAALCTSPAAITGAVAAQNSESRDTQSVRLSNADGEAAGTAEFKQVRHGVIISLDLENLTPGPHGLHIHETGACTPDFEAAGGHYDPLGAAHGFASEGGYHVGDLPNIHVGADGTARGDVFVQQVTLSGPDNGRYPFTLRDSDGSAIMIHAKADDYRSMDSAGGREACGVVFAPME